MNQYMEEARHEAAQCWCDDETSGKQMDPVLAEAFAKRLDYPTRIDLCDGKYSVIYDFETERT